MIAALVALVAASTGTVQIHLTDGHNKAIAHHQVWLEPTDETEFVHPYGCLWWIPDHGRFYTGTTDAQGNLKVPGVPRGEPMMVVTRFKSPFERKTLEKDGSDGARDVMKFDGAVYADKPVHVSLADDLKISGQIVHVETGEPVEGVVVMLTDTFDGHIGGYPLEDIAQTTTDAQGRYAFDHLPPCGISVRLAKVGKLTATEQRINDEIWFRQGRSNYRGDYSNSMEETFRLKRPETRVNFRFTSLADVELTVQKGEMASMRGWVVGVCQYRGLSSYRDDVHYLGYTHSGDGGVVPVETESFHMAAYPGRRFIEFVNDDKHLVFKGKMFAVKAGDRIKMSFDLSEVNKKAKISKD